MKQVIVVLALLGILLVSGCTEDKESPRFKAKMEARMVFEVCTSNSADCDYNVVARKQWCNEALTEYNYICACGKLFGFMDKDFKFYSVSEMTKYTIINDTHLCNSNLTFKVSEEKA